MGREKGQRRNIEGREQERDRERGREEGKKCELNGDERMIESLNLV